MRKWKNRLLSAALAGAMALSCLSGAAVVQGAPAGNGTEILQDDGAAAPIRNEQVARPDWNRDSCVSLNGWWEFDFDAEEVGQSQKWYEKNAHTFTKKIQVPFGWQASLSGIGDTDYLGQAWYSREFTVDPSWKGKKLFLKFGAVDWSCKLWVNGKEIGAHEGGYDSFEFDITEAVDTEGTNVITLWVEDKVFKKNTGRYELVGKQSQQYVNTRGIWQTVGLEARSATYLDSAKATPDVNLDSLDKSAVGYSLDIASDKGQSLTVKYNFKSTLYNMETDRTKDTGSVVSGSQKIQVKAGENTVKLDPIPIPNVKLWNHKEPNLYEGSIAIEAQDGQVLDRVDTYFGMRKTEIKYWDESLGTKYIWINGAPVHLSGMLDQGFWIEGGYTAPSEEALKYDVVQMRKAGFNLLRKHIKIEDPLQYYWCDKVGMYVWQDMPNPQNGLSTRTEGGDVPARKYYEECLKAALDRDYNHPSILAVILFNETWGLYEAYADDGKYRDIVSSDGYSIKTWIEHLYYMVKDIKPDMLVEDMSACEDDHVQPTDLNTYHMYPRSQGETKGMVKRYVYGKTYEGSNRNFSFGNVQDGDPVLNSEYGGVRAGDDMYDVSYCFKYQTDFQRRYLQSSGFVYTEPYDIEDEFNGFMTYDRSMKVFGYDEIAYGGDMTTADLLQDIYIGVEEHGATAYENVAPGGWFSRPVMTAAWTFDLPEEPVAKWRFDATDIYGNNFSTGLSGTLESLKLESYAKHSETLGFSVPDQACVGTLTVWLEDKNGEKIAKNFYNIIVADESSSTEAKTIAGKDGSISMQAKVENARFDAVKEASGSQSYTYTLPEDFNVGSLSSMRVLAEASSHKGANGKNRKALDYRSPYSQTAEGKELASDMTVSVNGIEIDTVYLPDNPRDLRGTLTLNDSYNLSVSYPQYGGSSAGDFGYLVNLKPSKEQMEQIKNTIDPKNPEMTVTYAVKEDAANKNGLHIYNSIYGRYAVNPTVILNPADREPVDIFGKAIKIKADSDNYSVEGILSAGASLTARSDGDGGYQAQLNADGTALSLVNARTKKTMQAVDGLAAGPHHVKVTLFDENIKVYVDNNPDPAINLYDKSGFHGGITAAAEKGASIQALTAVSETYEKWPVDTDKTSLEMAKQMAATLDESRYTAESFGELKAALAEADSVSMYDQDAIDAAAIGIWCAIANLEWDLTGLDAKLAEAEAAAQKAQEQLDQAQKDAQAAIGKAQEEAGAAKAAAQEAKAALEQAKADAKAAKDALEQAKADAQKEKDAFAQEAKDAQAALDQAKAESQAAKDALAQAKADAEAAANAQKEAQEALAQAQKEAQEAIAKAQKEAEAKIAEAAAQAAKAEEEAQKAQKEAQETQKKAQEALEAAEKLYEKSTTTDRKGIAFNDSTKTLRYQITKAAGKKTGAVTLTRVLKKGASKVSVPATVTWKGKTYKVTKIGPGAFKNCKKLTKATLGKNLSSIGAKAFQNCTKLKKIVIKGSALKKVGKSAFASISKKAVIDVPNAKVKAYTALLKKGKVPGKATIQ